MNEFSFSASESKAFDLNIYRSKISEMELDFIKSKFLEDSVDVVVSRIDTQLQNKLFPLFQIIPHSYLADTLVYYSCILEQKVKNELPPGLRIEIAGEEKRGELESLILRIFKGYQNHYHSNPLFKQVDLAKGYLEWNLPFLIEKDKICLIIYDNEVPCAFLTAKIVENESFADIILNGALKEYEGQGKYSFLIRALKNILIERNILKLIVSTQLTNQRVQRVWTKENFGLEQSFYTFHHFISPTSLQKLNSKF